MSTADRASLACLRLERQAQIAAAKERIKEQGRVLKLINRHLEGGPDTVPGIAQATGLNTGEVLWYLMAMRKYGLAMEGEKQGGYFRYALSADPPSPDQEAAREA